MGNIETFNKVPLENFSTINSKLLKNEIELEDIEKIRKNHTSLIINPSRYGSIEFYDTDDVNQCHLMLQQLENYKIFEMEQNIILSAENKKLKERIGHFTKLAKMWKSKSSMLNSFPKNDFSGFNCQNVVTFKSETGNAKWNLDGRHSEFDMLKRKSIDNDYIKMRSIEPIFYTKAGATNVELPEKQNIFYQKRDENSIMGIGFKYFWVRVRGIFANFIIYSLRLIK